MAELKTLKWPVGAKAIKEALEEANIDFDPELSRKDLWEVYKGAQKMQEEVPVPQADEAQDSGEKPSEPEDSATAPQPIQANGDPVEIEPEVEEPAKQVEDATSVTTQDSQVDSVSPNEAFSTEPDLKPKTDAEKLADVSLLLEDALVVLEELSPYQATLRASTRFVQRLSRTASKPEDMTAAYSMHEKLRRTIRYSPVQHGVIVAAFEVIYAAYEADYDLCREKYAEMRVLLNKKAANVSDATLSRYKRYNNPKWVRVALKDAD